MRSKHSTTELHPQLSNVLLHNKTNSAGLETRNGSPIIRNTITRGQSALRYRCEIEKEAGERSGRKNAYFQTYAAGALLGGKLNNSREAILFVAGVNWAAVHLLQLYCRVDFW